MNNKKVLHKTLLGAKLCIDFVLLAVSAVLMINGVESSIPNMVISLTLFTLFLFFACGLCSKEAFIKDKNIAVVFWTIFFLIDVVNIGSLSFLLGRLFMRGIL
ncbi:MAG: hypothetical protein LBM87_08420 [Ruminococcus sp.]|jgi:hypothetical protein|nr:hypothetical protein [Ruminococcus sp.]